jgi:hypothetical protein
MARSSTTSHPSDTAALGLHQPSLLQCAQQHDRTGNRQREAENQARADAPAQNMCQSHAE